MGGRGDLRDYCIPVNPYFPTPEIFQQLRDELETILKYYPTQSVSLTSVLGAITGLDPATLVLSNGSTEVITWIDHLFVRESLLTPVPTFGRWTDQPLETGKQLFTLQRRPENDFRLDPDEIVHRVLETGARSFVLCNPNNPTGALMPREDVVWLLEELRPLDIVVIDESFIDFTVEEGIPSVADVAAQFDNAIVVKSLGKNMGLHGVRLGYSVANRQISNRLQVAMPRWNINAVAEVMLRIFHQHATAYESSRRRVIQDRDRLVEQLAAIPGVHVYPSWGNFAMIRLPDRIPGTPFRNHLLTEYGFMVRECSNKIGSDAQHFRIAVRPPEDIDQLVGAMVESLDRFTVARPSGQTPLIAQRLAS